MQKLFVMLAIAAVTVGAASAFAGSLVSIGVLDETPPAGGSPASAIYAITPGGEYAVGYSNAGNIADSATINQPIIWSVGDGLVELPNPDDLDAQATGVVLRPLLEKVGVGGNVNGMMQYYTAFQSNLAGGTWLVNGRGSAAVVGPYNSARLAKPNYYLPSTYLNPWYIGGDWNNERDHVQGAPSNDTEEPPGHGIPSIDHKNTGAGDCVSYSVCNNAWTAGYDMGNFGSQRRALFMNSNNGSTQIVIPGGSGWRSKAYGINAAGSVLCGYDTDDEALTTSQAFVWKVGDAAMTMLGTLGTDTFAVGITCNVIGGDTIVAGYSAGTNQQAVVWDTTGTWDSSGSAQLLTTLLTNAGVDTSAWTRLTQATTMSDSGAVIAGYGVWAADGSTRGFVASLSAPPEVTSALSVKTHGATDYSINVLDRTANADVECRRYGVTQLVVGFDTDIQGVGGLDSNDVAISPQGTVDNVSLSASNELTITMSNTANAVPLIVTFPGIADASDAGAVCTDSICIRQLLGDTASDLVLTSQDRVFVRDQMGKAVTSSNFKMDVRADGQINVIDRVDVRDAMGTAFSGSCP